MPTRRQFIQSIPPAGAAFAVASQALLESSVVAAQTSTDQPVTGH